MTLRLLNQAFKLVLRFLTGKPGSTYFNQHHTFHIQMTGKIVSDLTQAKQSVFARILEKMLKKI
jgi:hypothetical protein